MIFLYVLLATYIAAVNFYAFRLVRSLRDECDVPSPDEHGGNAKLLLAGALGGAIAVYAAMFAMRFRLDNCLLMLGLPLLAVWNVYCFYLGFRGIYLFL